MGARIYRHRVYVSKLLSSCEESEDLANVNHFSVRQLDAIASSGIIKAKLVVESLYSFQKQKYVQRFHTKFGKGSFL